MIIPRSEKIRSRSQDDPLQERKNRLQGPTPFTNKDKTLDFALAMCHNLTRT